LKPLTNLRVLDLSRVLAGPYCTQIMGDLGAEVIKIERPGKGDDSRTMGPPFQKDAAGKDTDLSPMFMAANRSKKSICVNLSTKEGQDIVRELARASDVLVENYKVGDLARYELDYERLKAVNPRLVYCSITGFGQTGPYAARPGYDSIFQATAGLMSVTGYPDEMGGAPVRLGVSITDIIGGLHAVIAIQAALRHRDATGVGQYIDLALLDSAVASVSHLLSSYFVTGKAPARRGNEGVGGIPSDMWRCADGFLIGVAGNDAQYKRLCEVMKRNDLASDPRYLTNSERQKNKTSLYAVWREEFSKWKAKDAEALMLSAGLPVARVNDLAQVCEDPQVVHRGVVREIVHPKAGPLKTLSYPARFSETPIDDYAPPPSLGAQTDEILAELLGLDAAAIAELRVKHAIG
jgi:crotonobetainyl-CoA:carnitine CoA-transferase CaiB-like acyl-CoA transferase